MRGSSLPKVEKVVIVDLSRMDEIIRVDSKNKVVMVEPGVTYGKLLQELKKHGLRPLMPLLPKNSKSVLASCLDREPTTIPRFHWDISDPLLCTETVFGSGDTLRTGSAAGPGSLEEQWSSGQAQKNPQGPSQFDPFRIIQGSQGTIGITTWISMKCEYLPEEHVVYLAGADSLSELEDFNYAILRRRLVDEQFMLNSAGLSAALGKEVELPKWILVLGVSGHGVLAQDEIQYRTEDTMDIARDTNVKLEPKLGNLKATEVKDLLNRPSDSSYWKLAPRGCCTEVVFTTTLDQVERQYSAFLDIATQIGFPSDQIGVYIQPIVQGVNTHCGIDLFHDSESEAETVQRLVLEGSQRLMDEGAFFSRPFGIITDKVFERSSREMVQAYRNVKKIFDPNHVLNPGTLCFKEVSE
jgi:FAD/FMN-containing dehydrogenase